MGKKNRNPHKLPDRWLNYGPVGSVIDGTRFVCFKVPLSNPFCKRIPNKDDWFTPEQLLQYHIPSMGRTLGLVVDLTNTERYYNPQEEFETRDVKHKKIFCPGHDVPHPKIVQEFYSHVDDFMKETEGLLDPDGKELLIGVHCTHGVNRTGYFVCRYMVEKMGWTALGARKAFEEARGTPIERENYIIELEKLERKDTSAKESKKQKKKEKRKRKRKHSTSSEEVEESEEEEQEETNTVNPAHMMQMIQMYMSSMQQLNQPAVMGMPNMQWPGAAMPQQAAAVQPQATSRQPKAESISSASSPDPYGDGYTSVPHQEAAGASGYGDGPGTPVQDEVEESYTYDREAGPQAMPTKRSACQKRNERKQKGKKFTKIMEGGKFFEIQEAMSEKYGNK